ncbi:MAG: hypothetical protein IT376_13315 [Polyangiaceae bacterium]|nr:hypothetical protein [Polyangiaceae bacterium]
MSIYPLLPWTRAGLSALACLATVACGGDDEGAAGAAAGGGAGAGGHHASGGSAGTGSGGAAGAAGGASGASGASGAAGAPPSGLSVSLVEPVTATVGKSTLGLRIVDGSGAPVAGLASGIALLPAMDMGMHAHGAAVPSDAVHETTTAGTYDTTLFFPMASSGMGSWTLGVAVGGAAAAELGVTVAEAAGTDTTHVPLSNASDTVKSPMGLDKPRNWFLFRDVARSEGGGVTFGVFLATVQADAMLWPPVTVGLTLVDASGAEQLVVSSVEVSGSADGVTWAPMPCDATARCQAHFAGVSGGTSELRVKLSINGAPYTTDAAAPEPAGSNGYATFVVTPE